ncbi:lysylphosphatidylglycerol synthase transmembrane domain-containing protein [Anaerolentibacter hominis]|uniref:lysylphosphatidylglycerol synthase transmembrane domain-containing protein n=1 Tax=Anaerolentibacter hominis TaxID=3079009 RepID=UPI0031B87D0D
MASNKKKIVNALFFVLVFGLTIYSVFKGEDLKELFHTLTKANPLYLVLGAACVVFFIWGESIIIHYILDTLSVRTRKRTCFMYSCIGFFFSCITPSASGGQPAQVYYMHRDEIPIPVSSLVLMIVTVAYKSVLVLTGLFLVVFQRGFIHHYLEGILPVFYLGIGLNVGFCLILLLLIFHPALAKNMMLRCLSFLEKVHILKKKQERRERLSASMDQYNAASVYLKQHGGVMVRVLIITFLQRFALFFVTFLVYKTFHLKGTNSYDVVMLQAAISISVDMLPLPGGMGISEHLFLSIFAPVFGAAFLLPAMVLSRGLAYYVQLLLSAGVTMLAQIRLGEMKKKRTSYPANT